MALEPQLGLVIPYDFLFSDDHERGREAGKDRPCAVVLVMEKDARGARNIVVCPISHRSPEDPRDGVEVPAAIAKHLGLDEGRMWLKTRELNRFAQEEERMPFGVSPVAPGRWFYGHLPPRLFRRLQDRIVEYAEARATRLTDRDRGD